MFQRVLNYVNQHHMLTQGDGIVAGVSGGADSVCLLFVLQKIQEIFGGKLYVAHVNHGLRGEEAVADQEFVRRLCQEWKLPFYLKTVDLPAIACEKKLTEEEAGRLVRYDFFRETAKKTRAAKIAVGHNANDNAETLLFHLIRGSNLKGLGGISPVQGQIIRPLLCVKREEIEQYIKENELDFCMDKTNLEDTYTRNRIRHRLLPLMEEINPSAVEAVTRAAAACAAADDLIEKEAKLAVATFVEKCNGVSGNRTSKRENVRKCNDMHGKCYETKQFVVKKEAFATLHPAVLDQLLMEALSMATGSRKDIGAVHIGALRALQAGETGKILSLPYEVRGENQYGDLVFYKKKQNLDALDEEADSFGESVHFLEPSEELALPEDKTAGEILLPEGGRICYSIENYEKNVKIPKNRYTKWLDYDIIKDTLRFRTRRTGDWIQVLAQGGKKKLKDYLMDEKIPRSERNRLVLLAEGDEILWVVGYRLSEKVKVTENTKRILKLTYIGGNADGREDSGADFPGRCGEAHSGAGRADQ